MKCAVKLDPPSDYLPVRLDLFSHKGPSINDVVNLERGKEVKNWSKLLTDNWEFLEYWNTQKSVWRIWQHFSCLLDEGIPKIWKKLNRHSCFLRADLGSAKMCYQMGWIGCAILQVAKKAIMRIPFLSYFWNPNPLIKKCSQILQTLISIL